MIPQWGKMEPNPQGSSRRQCKTRVQNCPIQGMLRAGVYVFPHQRVIFLALLACCDLQQSEFRQPKMLEAIMVCMEIMHIDSASYTREFFKQTSLCPLFPSPTTLHSDYSCIRHNWERCM